MEGLVIDLVNGVPPVLRIAGEIDLANADQLGAALGDAMRSDPSLVVDMGDVAFIDVAGLRAILHMVEARNGNGPLTIVNARRVAWLLDTAQVEIPSLDLR